MQTQHDSTAVRKSPVPVEDCGAAHALSVVPDRWTWLILREMFYGVTRFADIQGDLGIPKSVLSGRLTQIVKNGLADKEPYRDGSARVRQEYVLTQKGRELAVVILAMMDWGDRHMKEGAPAVELTDKRSGLPLKVGLVHKGKVVPLRRLIATPVPNED